MSNLGQKQTPGTTIGQRGFTLIELLVVIGIIVALAGITVPLVTKFTGSGQTGAMAAERESVQTAMSAMMAEQDITTVTALVDPAAATNAWDALPTGNGSAFLFGPSGYLSSGLTDYYFCWTSGGEVYTRDLDPELSDDAGACRVPPP